jgi:hypothetical protein
MRLRRIAGQRVAEVMAGRIIAGVDPAHCRFDANKNANTGQHNHHLGL